MLKFKTPKQTSEQQNKRIRAKMADQIKAEMRYVKRHDFSKTEQNN